MALETGSFGGFPSKMRERIPLQVSPADSLRGPFERSKFFEAEVDDPSHASPSLRPHQTTNANEKLGNFHVDKIEYGMPRTEFKLPLFVNRNGGPFQPYPERIVGSLMVSKKLDAELSGLFLDDGKYVHECILLSSAGYLRRSDTWIKVRVPFGEAHSRHTDIRDIDTPIPKPCVIRS